MKQKVTGPYKVIKLNNELDWKWEVVEIRGWGVEGAREDGYDELRPRCRYVNRPSAYGKCLRLNKKIQEEEERALRKYNAASAHSLA